MVESCPICPACPYHPQIHGRARAHCGNKAFYRDTPWLTAVRGKPAKKESWPARGGPATSQAWEPRKRGQRGGAQPPLVWGTMGASSSWATSSKWLMLKTGAATYPHWPSSVLGGSPASSWRSLTARSGGWVLSVQRPSLRWYLRLRECFQHVRRWYSSVFIRTFIMGWIVSPLNSHVQVQIPSTSECWVPQRALWTCDLKIHSVVLRREEQIELKFAGTLLCTDTVLGTPEGPTF